MTLNFIWHCLSLVIVIVSWFYRTIKISLGGGFTRIMCLGTYMYCKSCDKRPWRGNHIFPRFVWSHAMGHGSVIRQSNHCLNRPSRQFYYWEGTGCYLSLGHSFLHPLNFNFIKNFTFNNKNRGSSHQGLG
jgi:hypothetical protein